MRPLSCFWPSPSCCEPPQKLCKQTRGRRWVPVWTRAGGRAVHGNGAAQLSGAHAATSWWASVSCHVRIDPKPGEFPCAPGVNRPGRNCPARRKGREAPVLPSKGEETLAPALACKSATPEPSRASPAQPEPEPRAASGRHQLVRDKDPGPEAAGRGQAQGRTRAQRRVSQMGGDAAPAGLALQSASWSVGSVSGTGPAPSRLPPSRGHRAPGTSNTATGWSCYHSNWQNFSSGSRLIWTWLPRYPRCAGVSGGITTIYMELATRAGQVSLQRFQTRMWLLTPLRTRPSVLELRPAHVSDSGVFSCANRTQAGPNISVTITPGCHTGASIHTTPNEPLRAGASVFLSCLPCGVQGPTASTAGGATWMLNGDPPPDTAALRVLRDKVTIDNFSSWFEGLWSCRLPGDPPRTGSYCLERETVAQGTQESPSPGTQESPSSSPHGPIAPGSRSGLKVLAGRCALTVLFLSASVGAVCYVHRKPLGPQAPAGVRPAHAQKLPPP